MILDRNESTDMPEDTCMGLQSVACTEDALLGSRSETVRIDAIRHNVNARRWDVSNPLQIVSERIRDGGNGRRIEGRPPHEGRAVPRLGIAQSMDSVDDPRNASEMGGPRRLQPGPAVRVDNIGSECREPSDELSRKGNRSKAWSRNESETHSLASQLLAQRSFELDAGDPDIVTSPSEILRELRNDGLHARIDETG